MMMRFRPNVMSLFYRGSHTMTYTGISTLLVVKELQAKAENPDGTGFMMSSVEGQIGKLQMKTGGEWCGDGLHRSETEILSDSSKERNSFKV